MNSIWWWIEQASEGTFGKRARKLVAVIAVTLVILGTAWPTPLHWCVQSIVAWKTHEMQSILRDFLNQLHFKRLPSYAG